MLNCVVFLYDPSLHRLFLSGISRFSKEHSSPEEMDSMFISCFQQSNELCPSKEHRYFDYSKSNVTPFPSQTFNESSTTAHSSHVSLRYRYRSPVTYWPGTNIPIYMVTKGL
ncbi:hypothetical protein DSO57_1007557 [Entomophthora muscae]|uniref:Uncharacterized protein n=1 Tax=Entomophthora muscae TaxID=34485 RepID=A0ACC2RM60_9FUNG|nr:hypothetical protein DSO57_1007557 [Entomophthora muscae]